MDASRLRTGEIVAGGGGLALFVFLFFDWFGGGAELTGTPGNLSVSRVGISGWDALTDLPGFLIILAGVSGIALAVLAAAGRRLNIPIPRGGVTASLGSLAVLLILWRMVAGSPTLKIGVFLALAAAVAIAVGAHMALAEDGFKPLVAVAGGGMTTVAAASAPPATPSPRPAATPTRSKSSSSSSRSTRSSAKKKSSGKKASAGRSSTKKSPTTKKKSSASRSSTATKARSSGSKTSKKSSSAKSRSSGGKRSSTSRKKK